MNVFKSKIYTALKTLLMLVVGILPIVTQNPTLVRALSSDQRNLFDSGVYFYDINPGATPDCTVGNTPVNPGSGANTVVLDPGHSSGPDFSSTAEIDGAATAGYSSVNIDGTGVESIDNSGASGERATMWQAAQLIKTKLTTDGYNVILTKKSADDNVGLLTRAKVANDAHAAIAVSLHYTGNVQFGSQSTHWGVTPQVVGEKRTNESDGKTATFTDAALAQTSQNYANIIQKERAAAGDPVSVANLDDSFPQSRGLPAYGNISIVQLFSKVPWVYNEDGAVGFDLQKYATGIANGIEKSVPITRVTPVVSGASGGSYNLDQVKSFASTPITSTWNISDSAVEQWFLDQKSPVIARYGLNSSNIGDITSAVRAANISPVFFYLYTVNEVGAGSANDGFINHTDRSGLDAVAAATADAQYLAEKSQITNGKPATGGGEPPDMPIAEAQQILGSLPAGSLGVAYIQATAAATAELEDLSGITGDWSGKYGKPLSDSMRNIQSMGGDPLQGGASLSAGDCTGSVTGEGITKAINWAVMIANNDGYGYNQDTRTTGWEKWQSDPSCTNQCGSFDCSSFVDAALTEAGYFTTNQNFATFTEAEALAGAGFKDVTSSISLTTGAGLLPGDILINTKNHTEMYIGYGQTVAARTVGGHPEAGDQTGHEIETKDYGNYPWDAVYRATK